MLETLEVREMPEIPKISVMPGISEMPGRRFRSHVGSHNPRSGTLGRKTSLAPATASNANGHLATLTRTQTPFPTRHDACRAFQGFVCANLADWHLSVTRCRQLR